jgi:hypothetical protein
VRQRLQDIVDIHERKLDRRLRHFSRSSPQALRARVATVTF